MSGNVLEDQELVLGVQESWDSYHEVPVQFVGLVTLNNYTYHMFDDKLNRKRLYLRPRYRGGQIEAVFVEKRVVVSIFDSSFEGEPNQGQEPRFYATGLLQLPKGFQYQAHAAA